LTTKRNVSPVTTDVTVLQYKVSSCTALVPADITVKSVHAAI